MKKMEELMLKAMMLTLEIDGCIENFKKEPLRVLISKPNGTEVFVYEEKESLKIVNMNSLNVRTKKKGEIYKKLEELL
jgi:hypothetical protein